MSSSDGEGVRVRIVKLGTLPPAPPVRWVWKPYIPIGFLTLVEGQEGVGKGYLGAWLAVRLAKGQMHDRVQRGTLWVTSEERAEKVEDRLKLLGYDRSTDAPINLLVLEGDNALLTMPKHRNMYRAAARQLGCPIGLTVVDVLRDHSDMTGAPEVRFKSNNDEAWIRPAARSWDQLAGELGCGILGNHHRNKSTDGDARSKSTGSGAWRQVCRHVVTMALVGDQRAVAMEKTNIAKEDKEPIRYSLEVVKLGVDEDGDDITEAYFKPGERTGCDDINDWERQARKAADIDKTELAEVWLEEQAKQGRLQYGAFWKRDYLQSGMGYSERQTKQILTKLREAGVVGFHTRNGWYLVKPSGAQPSTND